MGNFGVSQIERAKGDGEARRSDRLDPLVRLLVLDVRVAVSLRLAMDGRDEGLGVDHPQLAKVEAGIDVGLGAEVVAEARVGHLDDEERVGGGHVLEGDASRPEQEIGS